MKAERQGRSEPLTFAARAERYARAVVSGEKLAGKWVIAACQRHLDDLERSQRDLSWPYVFDEQACGRVCHFLQCLPHIKGRWARPVVQNGRTVAPLIVLEDWQVFAYGVPFGWVHRLSRMRRFRWIYLEVARKNAKSTPCAGLALYLGFADGEPGAEVYSLGTKEKQARIVWEMARSMVLRELEFRLAKPHGLGIGTTRRAIFQDHTESKYEPLGRDSDTLDGLNAHGFVGDELHAWKDRTLWDVMASSVGSREQPMGVAITTAGYNSAGVCAELRQYLSNILNAVLLRHGGMGYRVSGNSVEDETFFGLIYTLDSDYADAREPDNWADPTMWIKANPNLGVSVFEEELAAACKKALASPQSQAEFRTKRCNQWLAADSVWMDMAKWDQCADPGLTLEKFHGEPAYVGIDAAFKTDVFAKVVVIRRGSDYYAFGRYWFPEAKADPDEAPELWAWAQSGLVTLSPGQVIDIELVRGDLREDRKQLEVREIPFDPAMLSQFSAEMLDEGAPMVEISPTISRFSEPMKLLEELILQGRFHHNGDPVLRWMISNVICEHRRGLIFPKKPVGEERARKIDAVIALLMALGRASLNAGPAQMPDDYELLTT